MPSFQARKQHNDRCGDLSKPYPELLPPQAHSERTTVGPGSARPLIAFAGQWPVRGSGASLVRMVRMSFWPFLDEFNTLPYTVSL